MSIDEGWLQIDALVGTDEADEFAAMCDTALAQLAAASIGEVAEPTEPVGPLRSGDKHSGGTRRLVSLEERFPGLRTVVEDPRLRDAAASLAVGLSLTELTYRCPQPGHGSQKLHTDDVPKLDPGPERVVTAIIALCDFTADNGATRIVPGSHRRPDLQNAAGDLESHPEERLLVGGAGTAFVFSGHLLHSGTQNRSGEPRPALQVCWRR